MEDTQENRTDSASDAYNTSVQIDSNRPEALLAKGIYLMRENMFDKSLKIFLKIYEESDQKTVELCRLIGFCYQQLERPELAKKFYDEAITIHKSHKNLDLAVQSSIDAITKIMN